MLIQGNVPAGHDAPPYLKKKRRVCGAVTFFLQTVSVENTI